MQSSRATDDFSLRASAGSGVAVDTIGSRLARLHPLGDDDHRALSRLLEERQWIAAGRGIAADGPATQNACALLEGWVCRCKDFRDGRRQIIALLTPGEIIGADEAGSPRRTDFALRTLTRTQVAWFPRARLREVLDDHPRIATAMRAAAAVEKAILRAWLVNLGQRTAIERLAFLFCEMSERLGDEKGAAQRFALPLTQQSLADVLGLTPVHVNRVLQRLRRDGLVEFHDGLLTIQDLSRTQALAGFDNAYLGA